MKNGNLIKFLAAFAVAAYLLAMTGFNVHCCAQSGEVFVASLMTGATCHDFHPDHQCHSGCCHEGHSIHDEHGFALSETDCCFNYLFQLTFTGSIQGEDEHGNHPHCACNCGHCPLAPEFGEAACIFNFSTEDTPPFSLSHTFSECRAVLNIWRL